LISEYFHEIEPRYNFTKEEIELIRSTQSVFVGEFVPELMKKILFTQLFSPVLELIKAKVGLPYDETVTKEFGDPKMLIYSVHDYQLTLMMDALKPTNVNHKWVEYASSFLFEVHYNQSISSIPYSITPIFNSIPLALSFCPHPCPLSTFINHISNQFVPDSEIAKLCPSNNSIL
jgi:hypothetical protein